MEPLAPGTEDEVPVTFPVYSKKANEDERLLAIKGYLPNGKYGNVFELSYVNGSEYWYCNLCECPVMGRVYHHEIGKRHNINVQNSVKKVGRAAGGGAPLPEAPSMQVAPGEPLPPGLEREMQKPTQIQERLDSFTVSPLVGLEYLLEIQEYDRDKEPSYVCMLCDKRGDPRTVIAHLVSYNHITQYLQRHFVKAYQALSPYITKQYKRNWQSTMNKIAEAIEEKYGRLKPHLVEKEGFEERKSQYGQQIFHGPHFNDKNGATFEDLVVREEITKVIEEPPLNIQKLSEDVAKRTYRKTGSIPGASEPMKKKRSPTPPVVAKPSKKPKPAVAAPAVNRERRRSLSSVSSISSSDLSEFEPEAKKGYRNRSPPHKYKSRSRSPFRKDRYLRRSPSPRPYRERGGMLPWQRPDYIKSRNDTVPDRNKAKTNKFDEFRKLAGAIETDMEKTMRQHEKNPEKHPQYNDEWKSFWNRRYKELQGEGKDAATYDFKPEWIVFWHKRMTELHNNELKQKKDALRKRLGLIEEPAPICFRITGKKKPTKEDGKSNKPAPMASEPDEDHEVIVIEDKDDDTKSSKRSHSPWESEPLRPLSRLSREKSRDRDYSYDRRSRDRDRGYEHRSRDRNYKRDYRTPEKRYRDKSRGYREKSWEEDSYTYRKEILECYKPPSVMRDVTRQPVYTTEREEDDLDDGDINVVGVLRLLTALEEKLGSLGPKIIDMLAQALALEKNEANSSETLLDNDINCVLFETVKEKLKGQLLAGLVDYNQEKAFKNAIRNIASLVHFANKRRLEKQKSKPKVDPVKVPGIGTVDKAAIAKQIATALVSQGKTDVTQQELEQLINAVVGMAEASKKSDKPVTTASFLETLTNVQMANKSQQAKKPPNIAKTENDAPTPPLVLQSTNSSDTSSMEGLSDSDLQTLLQNFKDLSTEEQHGLITYLKKLESKEPERVERLRKFVNLGPGQTIPEQGEEDKPAKESRASSPFSTRLAAGSNPTDKTGDFQFDDDEKEEIGEERRETPKKEAVKINLDSDDEEYSYEDVFKAANKNVTESELERERKKAESKPKVKQLDLSDAKALIANIMGSISRKESPGQPTKNEGQADPQPSVSQSSIVNAMGKIPFNVSNLANIVGSIQSMEKKQAASSAGFVGRVDSQRSQMPSRSYVPQNLQAPQNPQPNQMYGMDGVNMPPQSYPTRERSYIGQPVNSTNVSQNLGHQTFHLGQRHEDDGVPPSPAQQNIQYPLKAPYENVNYSHSTTYTNQGAYNRGQQLDAQSSEYDQLRYSAYSRAGNQYARQGNPESSYDGSRW